MYAPSEPTEDAGGLAIGAVIGIALGILCCTVAAAAVAFSIYRKRNPPVKEVKLSMEEQMRRLDEMDLSPGSMM